MSCRLFGAKPLPEPMLIYCQLDFYEQSEIWIKIFIQENGFVNVLSAPDGPLVGPTNLAIRVVVPYSIIELVHHCSMPGNLVPFQHKFIIWNNADLSSIEHMGMNTSRISIKIQVFFHKNALEYLICNMVPFLPWCDIWTVMKYILYCCILFDNDTTKMVSTPKAPLLINVIKISFLPFHIQNWEIWMP